MHTRLAPNPGLEPHWRVPGAVLARCQHCRRDGADQRLGPDEGQRQGGHLCAERRREGGKDGDPKGPDHRLPTELARDPQD